MERVWLYLAERRWRVEWLLSGWVTDGRGDGCPYVAAPDSCQRWRLLVLMLLLMLVTRRLGGLPFRQQSTQAFPSADGPGHAHYGIHSPRGSCERVQADALALGCGVATISRRDLSALLVHCRHGFFQLRPGRLQPLFHVAQYRLALQTFGDLAQQLHHGGRRGLPPPIPPPSSSGTFPRYCDAARGVLRESRPFGV